MRSEAIKAARSDVDCLRGEGRLRPRGVAPGGMGEPLAAREGSRRGVSPLRRGWLKTGFIDKGLKKGFKRKG